MGVRGRGEPPYPQSEQELAAYCSRFLLAVRDRLGERLVCLLLCGSWARGEACPPDSDADLAVVVDSVDGEVISLLRAAWAESGMGCANVYGLDEVRAMARDGVEMYTINAKVLWGANPFRTPTRADFAADLARVAESIARDARCLLLYGWLSDDDRRARVEHLVGKYQLQWALKKRCRAEDGHIPHEPAGDA